jgi:hypothetical protein
VPATESEAVVVRFEHRGDDVLAHGFDVCFPFDLRADVEAAIVLNVQAALAGFLSSDEEFHAIPHNRD